MIARPAYSRAEVDRARVMAREIVAHHFGAPPRWLRHREAGLSNTVFDIDHAEGRFIVRIAPDPSRLPAFHKEQWSIAAARRAGVPVPEVLEVGQTAAPRPYMIQRRLLGEPAVNHPGRIGTLRELGRLARRIGSIRTRGYGESFDWCTDRDCASPTLGAFLADEYRWRHRLDVLKRHRMLSRPQAAAVASAMRDLEASAMPASLAHGDLRLKNVLVDRDGAIVAIIDWDNACSAVAPAWDLALALHDLAIDAKHALIEGSGISSAEMHAMAPLLKALNILHYAPWIERCADGDEHAMLDVYRLRLSGSLDLFAI